MRLGFFYHGFWMLLIGTISLVAAGCGSETGTVSGTVLFQGNPIKNGSVIIYCADKQIVRGVIVDGHYSIPNVPYGSAIATIQANPKAPAGLRPNQPLPPVTNGPVEGVTAAADPVDQIPQRYSLLDESGLILNVDSRHVTFEIDLKP